MAREQYEEVAFQVIDDGNGNLRSGWFPTGTGIVDGNMAVDYVWGNFPLQPNNDRTDDSWSFGGGEAPRRRSPNRLLLGRRGGRRWLDGLAQRIAQRMQALPLEFELFVRRGRNGHAASLRHGACSEHDQAHATAEAE